MQLGDKFCVWAMVSHVMVSQSENRYTKLLGWYTAAGAAAEKNAMQNKLTTPFITVSALECTHNLDYMDAKFSNLNFKCIKLE